MTSCESFPNTESRISLRGRPKFLQRGRRRRHSEPAGSPTESLACNTPYPLKFLDIAAGQGQISPTYQELSAWNLPGRRDKPNIVLSYFLMQDALNSGNLSWISLAVLRPRIGSIQAYFPRSRGNSRLP